MVIDDYFPNAIIIFISKLSSCEIKIFEDPNVRSDCWKRLYWTAEWINRVIKDPATKIKINKLSIVLNILQLTLRRKELFALLSCGVCVYFFLYSKLIIGSTKFLSCPCSYFFSYRVKSMSAVIMIEYPWTIVYRRKILYKTVIFSKKRKLNHHTCISPQNKPIWTYSY